MTGPDQVPEEHPGMPRWLKLSLVAVVAVVVVLIVLSLLGVAPDHGPDLH